MPSKFCEPLSFREAPNPKPLKLGPEPQEPRSPEPSTLSNVVEVLVVVVVSTPAQLCPNSGTYFCGGGSIYAMERESGGTQLTSLTVTLLMSLATLALLLTFNVRHNSGLSQVCRPRTSIVLKWGGRTTASWEPLGPKQGCMGPTNAPAPGLTPRSLRCVTPAPVQISRHSSHM